MRSSAAPCPLSARDTPAATLPRPLSHLAPPGRRLTPPAAPCADFDTFLPEAIATARQLASQNTSAKSPGLVFTTQSWLLSLYLDCPAHFPAPPVGDAPPSAAPDGRQNCSIPAYCAGLTGCSMLPECRCDCGYPGITPAE